MDMARNRNLGRKNKHFVPTKGYQYQAAGAAQGHKLKDRRQKGCAQLRVGEQQGKRGRPQATARGGGNGRGMKIQLTAPRFGCIPELVD
eukprot:scaffold122932_cov28-Tisochrysis_lutea.AAC.1